ncbi:copper transporter [Plasmodium gonderi]|uniref:Copper transport protein n=1 Tax=Plasmodium gonderi TaxID=77519 RepID=A0A1Y1JRA0_PLAGO|nr:copper transporter [Plasmodium gonderi]GAW83003.1 copper transporter [Plasmodium gonderi]
MKGKRNDMYSFIILLFYIHLPAQIKSNSCHGNKSKDGDALPMYFSNDINIKFLFDFFQVTNRYEFFLCNVICLLLGIISVYIKVLKKIYFKKCPNALEEQSIMVNNTFSHKNVKYGILSLFNYTIDFALMLIVMTFNVYIFLSVILGVSVGYFFYGHLLTR